MRVVGRDLIRGGHYGQRSCEPHLKAEHMAAPTNAAKREESSCQHGAVHTWHKPDMPPWSVYVRCRGQSGSHMLALSFSAFDPTATLAVHCGNDIDAGFSPYQSAQLNRYDAIS
jgi:hypothetical protein